MLLEVRYAAVFKVTTGCAVREIVRKFTPGEFASYFRKFGSMTKIHGVRAMFV